jgi:uncharacterized protein (DUF433 family)
MVGMAAKPPPSHLEHRSFRLSRRLLGEIKRRAEIGGVSQTALVERYLEEGTHMDEHPLIVFRDSPVGRRAMLGGTRLDVSQVVATLLAEDRSVEAAAMALGLGTHHVHACVRYYAEHQAEVDDYAAHVTLENERLREAYDRERALLAG